jgi:tetratricopeptide (TPR) repeat protein
MNLCRRSRAGALLVVLMPLSAVGADHYWAYTYQGIVVTAAGGAEFARTIAHNLHRLDLSLAAVLSNSSGEWRPPTSVFAVPRDTFVLLVGKDESASFTVRPFENTIIINSSANGGDRYWSVYFGFTGSVLNTYSFRYPPWFISGLSEVFAASSVDRSKVTIGGTSPGRVYTLQRKSLIPLKTMLALRWDDPQFASEDFQQLYWASAWFLVHQIVIEKQYHSNFYQYFQRLDHGESEETAFAESFDISYEELDKVFRNSFARGKLTIINVSIQDQTDESEPRQLSEAEAKGRLSIVAAERSPQADFAIKMSAQALALDPRNEDAQIGQAGALLRESDYAAALRAGESLCTADALSPKGAAACGHVFAGLASAVAAKKASLGMDQGSLAGRALRYYEKAVALNPNDNSSWYGLATLVNDTHDVAYAKMLKPKVETVQAKHPRIGALAESVSSLSAMSGDYENAVKYALIWQSNALSSSDRARASAYVSRLKDYMERKHIAESPIAPH